MEATLCCSFCGKAEQEIIKLIEGPGGVHICNECVELCRSVMGDITAPPPEFHPAAWPTDRLLAALARLSATAEAHRRHLGDVVDTLRARNVSWAKIAQPLGVSRQTAHERFG